MVPAMAPPLRHRPLETASQVAQRVAEGQEQRRAAGRSSASENGRQAEWPPSTVRLSET